MAKKESESILNATCSHEACKNKGSYLVPVICRNCEWIGFIRWTKGHHSYSIQEECPRCECRTLARDESRKALFGKEAV